MSSNTEIAYLKIRERIMHGEYMPGTLLSENELAEQMGMSRTPIRVAISRLESEGYLVSLKNRGVLVKDISIKEMADMMEVTVSLQNQVLERVIEQRASFDLSTLKEHLDGQLHASDNDDYYSYLKHSLLFVRCFVATINNQAMLQVLDSFQDKLMVAAFRNYKNTPHIKHYSANQSHSSVYQSLCDKDYEGTKLLLKQHVENGMNRLVFQGGM